MRFDGTILLLFLQHLLALSQTQNVHIALWYILGPESRYMGTPLGPGYTPYTYMEPVGKDPKLSIWYQEGLN